MRSGPGRLGAGGCTTLRSIAGKSNRGKLNGPGTAASDRVHLREIAVIFGYPDAHAPLKDAKMGCPARHRVACRRGVAPI